jgi:hypothetical protein
MREVREFHLTSSAIFDARYSTSNLEATPL